MFIAEIFVNIRLIRRKKSFLVPICVKQFAKNDVLLSEKCEIRARSQKLKTQFPKRSGDSWEKFKAGRFHQIGIFIQKIAADDFRAFESLHRFEKKKFKSG
jgi:hypothetical protein